MDKYTLSPTYILSLQHTPACSLPHALVFNGGLSSLMCARLQLKTLVATPWRPHHVSMSRARARCSLPPPLAQSDGSDGGGSFPPPPPPPPSSGSDGSPSEGYPSDNSPKAWAPEGAFGVVTGIPGSGKSTLLIEAAKLRGSAVYVDATVAETFDEVVHEINTGYPNLFPSFKNMVSGQSSSGFETMTALASLVYFITKRPLVLIVDHVHKLKEEGALRLASKAKAAADKRNLIVVLVGSEDSVHLKSGSDFFTRGTEIHLHPPQSGELRQLIKAVLKGKEFEKVSDKEKEYIAEELLYLAGPNPASIWSGLSSIRDPSDLAALKESTKRTFMQLQRGTVDLDFWYQLLASGSKGVPCEPSETRSDALNDNCLYTYREKTFFRNGFCRDWYAHLCSKAATNKEHWQQEHLQSCMQMRTYESYGPVFDNKKHEVRQYSEGDSSQSSCSNR